MVEKRIGTVICDNVIGSLLMNIQGYHFLHAYDTCALLSTLSFVTQLEMNAENYHTRKYPILSHIIVLTELISMLYLLIA